MKYRLITLACLLGAITSYFTGKAVGVDIFFAAGIFFEVAFWLRLSRQRKVRQQQARSSGANAAHG